jgi:hypothetical protein
MKRSGDQNSKNCARMAEGSQGDEGTFWCNSEIIFTPKCHFPERHSFDPIVELLADQRSRVQLHVRVNTTACGSRSICEAGVSISHTFVKRSWPLNLPKAVHATVEIVGSAILRRHAMISASRNIDLHCANRPQHVDCVAGLLRRKSGARRTPFDRSAPRRAAQGG